MLSSEHWKHVVCIICVSIGFGVFLPIMLYWFYRTYKYRHQSFIRSRHPKILFFNCILSCFCIIERNAALIRDLDILLSYNILIRNVLYVLVFGLYIHLYLLRHWLLFYDLGYREAQVNIRWEHDLNVFRSHWFIDHRTNLGNVSFMLCLVFCLFILVFIGLFLLHWLHSQILWGIGISIYGSILALIFIVISHKISKINKSLLMKREMFYVGIVLLFTSIIYSLIINILDVNGIAMIVISWSISISVPFLLHIMSTWYQIKSNTHSRGLSNKQQQKMQLLFDRLPKQKITLRDILKDQAGFKLFIRHLIKDLCVENLIYLSYVIQFKTMYAFLVQKELEDKRTRTGIIEGDDESDNEEQEQEEHEEEYDDEYDNDDGMVMVDQHHDEQEQQQQQQRPQGRHKALSASSSSMDSANTYYFEYKEEYKELYGWNMELPKSFGIDKNNNSRILLSLYELQNDNNYNELTNTMYQESLNIYTRFVKVSSKDEINISGKMRKSLKKYFEIEEIVSPQNLIPSITTTLQNATKSMQTQMKSNKSRSKSNFLPDGLTKPLPTQHSDSLNFPSLPGQMTSSKSNDSMNVRLTAQDSLNLNNQSTDFDATPRISINGINGKLDTNTDDIEVIIDENIDHQRNKSKTENNKPRTSGINRLSQKLNVTLSQKPRTRKEKTRSIIAIEPNDNYLKLDWIQRFKIFDRSCDSIEKLLRIDSYGKFRESPEYLMFCDQLNKKSNSRRNLMINKVSNIGRTITEVRRKHSVANGQEQQQQQDIDNNNNNNTDITSNNDI